MSAPSPTLEEIVEARIAALIESRVPDHWEDVGSDDDMDYLPAVEGTDEEEMYEGMCLGLRKERKLGVLC